MKMKLIAFCCAAGLALSVRAEDVQFFETAYSANIVGVRPIGTYDDPDAYYTEIAKQLHIPEVAYCAVDEQDGWSRTNSVALMGIVRRTQGTWKVLIVRFTGRTEDGKLDMKTYQQRFVTINDKKDVVRYSKDIKDDVQPQGGGYSPPAARPSNPTP